MGSQRIRHNWATFTFFWFKFPFEFWHEVSNPSKILWKKWHSELLKKVDEFHIHTHAHNSAGCALKKLYIYIYIFFFWLVALSLHRYMQAFSSCPEWGLLSVPCSAFPPWWSPPMRSRGSRLWASGVVLQRLSGPKACGVFPNQGSNPCPLHWQVDS